MEYSHSDWKFCDYGSSYYVYDDEFDPGRCMTCREKSREKRKKRKEKEASRIK